MDTRVIQLLLNTESCYWNMVATENAHSVSNIWESNTMSLMHIGVEIVLKYNWNSIETPDTQVVQHAYMCAALPVLKISKGFLITNVSQRLNFIPHFEGKWDIRATLKRTSPACWATNGSNSSASLWNTTEY